MITIAILGANGHIAKGLISKFLQEENIVLHLYTRSPYLVNTFIKSLSNDLEKHSVYDNYFEVISQHKKYDVIINCVGAGLLNKSNGDFSSWFTLTEKYDNMIINYLKKNPSTLYINLSSGAAYGNNFLIPVSENTENKIQPNHITPEQYYGIAKLNSETKHRAFKDLHIVDLRLFSYFSRYADINEGYFIGDVLNSILNNKTFHTSALNFTRDYIHPVDLYLIIQKFIKIKHINDSFDVLSKEPVSKFEILDYFEKNYGLKCEMDGIINNNPTGNKRLYYSTYDKLKYKAFYTSMETIEQEAKFILEKQ